MITICKRLDGWHPPGEAEKHRRAKFYQLTGAGQRQRKTETGDWRRIALAIASSLQTR
jgi:hypothetical protein